MLGGRVQANVPKLAEEERERSPEYGGREWD
jgi:hypothetical protein